MKLFTKKIKPIENITFISIMAALTIAFVALISFFNILTYVLAIFLPLFASLVCVFCKKWYYPIYAVVVLLISSLAFFFRIELVLFTLVPSLISGFLFGFFIEKKLSVALLLAGSSLIYTLFSILSLSLYGLMTTGVFDYHSIFKVLGLLENNEMLDNFLLSILFIYALVQNALSFIVTYNELSRFTTIEFDREKEKLIIPVSVVVSTLIGVLCVQYLPLGYLFTTISLLLSIYLVVLLMIQKKVYLYILVGFLVVLMVFLFAGLYPIFGENNIYLSFNYFSNAIAILTIINLLLFAKNKKDTIKNNSDTKGQ